MSITPSSRSRLQELLPELFQSPKLQGDPYLRCELIPEVSVLLSMEYVQESLLVPGEKITPLPNMSPFVLGLMNSRDRVFCVLNLADLLGLSSPSTSAREYHMIVLRVSELMSQQSTSEQKLLLGMVFHQIQGVTRAMSEQMRSPQGNFPSSLTPYLGGEVISKGQHLPVLDLAKIVNHAF